jgi:predicted RNA-binding protein with PUA domain
VQCNGKRLPPGKYSVSVRFNGKVWQATLNQKGHAIEIAAVVAAEARKPHNERDEVVVIENDKKVRTLSVVRVSEFDFVFDAKPRKDPLQDNKRERTEKLPLAVIFP